MLSTSVMLFISKGFACVTQWNFRKCEAGEQIIYFAGAVKVNSELFHFRSSAFVLIRAKSGEGSWHFCFCVERSGLFLFLSSVRYLNIAGSFTQISKCCNTFQCRWSHIPHRQDGIVPNGAFSRILSSLVLSVYVMVFFHLSGNTT